MMNGYEKNVWFNAQGQWQMTQTEWGDTDELSATVYNAYASGPYSGWQVEDVTYVEFPKWQPIIVIKVGQQNVDIQYQLFYSPNGTLLRTRNVSYMDDILGPGTFCSFLRIMDLRVDGRSPNIFPFTRKCLFFIP